MKTTANPTPIRPRVARGLELLMDFQDLKVEYRQGANNVVTDTLSRCPFYQPVEAEPLRDATNDTTEVGNCFLVQATDDDLQESQRYTKALTPLQEGEKDRQRKIRGAGSWWFKALQPCNEFSTALTTVLNHNQRPVMEQIRGKQHEVKLTECAVSTSCIKHMIIPQQATWVVMEPLLYPVQSEKGPVKLLAPPNRRPNGEGAPGTSLAHRICCSQKVGIRFREIHKPQPPSTKWNICLTTGEKTGMRNSL
ncbi:hypothetical protein EBH_0000240 [Eimeria brunetti]|uniref:Reverse transcriptase RNase H-like domain-containing protein n=1 Tax=Eimeria brunetti TaxID=51314 RepID=U6LRF9_9EIME|nr:hypothetical protein EBH_0000240 [Eimeria brunetti]